MIADIAFEPEINTNQIMDTPKEINKLIAKSTAKATAIAALPIPILDLVGTTYIQVDMVNKIGKHYNVESEDSTKLIVSSVITSLVSKLISELTSSIAHKTKLEKIISESLIKATIIGFVTGMTGEIYDDHFRRGGTIETMTIENYKRYATQFIQSDKADVTKIAENLIGKII